VSDWQLTCALLATSALAANSHVHPIIHAGHLAWDLYLLGIIVGWWKWPKAEQPGEGT
jgi:hypothetical protein